MSVRRAWSAGSRARAFPCGRARTRSPTGSPARCGHAIPRVFWACRRRLQRRGPAASTAPSPWSARPPRHAPKAPAFAKARPPRRKPNRRPPHGVSARQSRIPRQIQSPPRSGPPRRHRESAASQPQRQQVVQAYRLSSCIRYGYAGLRRHHALPRQARS